MTRQPPWSRRTDTCFPYTTLFRSLAALLMAGCGLSHDDEAQPIAADNLPADLLAPSQPATSTTLPPSDTKPVTIYLLRGTSDGAVLVPVQREVAEPDRAGAQIGRAHV